METQDFGQRYFNSSPPIVPQNFKISKFFNFYSKVYNANKSRSDVLVNNVDLASVTLIGPLLWQERLMHVTSLSASPATAIFVTPLETKGEGTDNSQNLVDVINA